MCISDAKALEAAAASVDVGYSSIDYATADPPAARAEPPGSAPSATGDADPTGNVEGRYTARQYVDSTLDSVPGPLPSHDSEYGERGMTPRLEALRSAQRASDDNASRSVPARDRLEALEQRMGEFESLDQRTCELVDTPIAQPARGRGQQTQDDIRRLREEASQRQPPPHKESHRLSAQSDEDRFNTPPMFYCPECQNLSSTPGICPNCRRVVMREATEEEVRSGLDPAELFVGSPSLYAVDTREFNGASGHTALGYPRDRRQFFETLLKTHPELFSVKNRKRIRARQPRAPEVDETWLRYHPEHELYLHDKLEHHHWDQGPWAFALPKHFHKFFTKVLHPLRYPTTSREREPARC
jgi:hypothetical protein